MRWRKRRTLRAGIRSLPGPVWILCAGSFVNRFGSFVAVFLILYLREKGYSIAEAGFIVSLYGAGNVVAAAVGGLVADRLGRRNAIAISMFSSAATLLALSQADEIVLIGALTVLAGLTGEMYRPASAALLADLVPAGQRLPAFALNRLAINLGFAAGPATAGLLADYSFTYLFVGDALTSLVFGALALAALPEGVRTRRGEERRGEGSDDRPRPRVPVLPRLVDPRRLRLLPGERHLPAPRQGERAVQRGLRSADLAERAGDRPAGAAVHVDHPALPSDPDAGRRLGPRRPRVRAERLGRVPRRARLHRPDLDDRRDRLRARRVGVRRRHRAGACPGPVPGRLGADVGPCVHARPWARRRVLRVERRRVLALLRRARRAVGRFAARRVENSSLSHAVAGPNAWRPTEPLAVTPGRTRTRADGTSERARSAARCPRRGRSPPRRRPRP